MPKNSKATATSKNVALYPVHLEIVREFGEQDGRNFSNAMQYIIEDWARLTGHRHTGRSRSRSASGVQA